MVRAAANTDINTIFGAVINENLNDEVIVTVIATGFDEVQPAKKPTYVEKNTKKFDPDEDIDSDIEIPPFLRSRGDDY